MIAVNASAIDQNKRRGDIGITYDQEVLCLIDKFLEVWAYMWEVLLLRSMKDRPLRMYLAGG